MNENLKPYRSEDEAREGGRRGGIASGEARRRKKSMREWAEVLGEVAMHLKTPDGADVPDGNAAAAVVLKQYQKAINKSDTNAAAFLMRLRGEDVQKIEQVDDEVKIHFELIFVFGIRTFCSFFLLQVVDQFSQHHLLKRLFFFSIVYFLFLLSKIRCPLMGGFISGLSILFH